MLPYCSAVVTPSHTHTRTRIHAGFLSAGTKYVHATEHELVIMQELQCNTAANTRRPPHMKLHYPEQINATPVSFLVILS